MYFHLGGWVAAFALLFPFFFPGGCYFLILMPDFDALLLLNVFWGRFRVMREERIIIKLFKEESVPFF